MAKAQGRSGMMSGVMLCIPEDAPEEGFGEPLAYFFGYR